MDSKIILLDVAPEVEVANGFIYLLVGGRRAFAYPPHVARIANNRIRKALDDLDAANTNKVVGFR